jgi:hypothetical protein
MKFMSHYLALSLFATALAVSADQALASQDCRQEARAAVEDCSSVASAAEQANSDVASGMAPTGAYMNQGGSDLSSVSEWGRGNLIQASAQCSRQLDKCINACNRALSSAREPSLIGAIKQNAKYCNDSISNSQARLDSGQRQLASAAQQSQSTALSSGDSAYNDSVIAEEQAARPEDLQQAGVVGSYRVLGNGDIVIPGGTSNGSYQIQRPGAGGRGVIVNGIEIKSIIGRFPGK